MHDLRGRNIVSFFTATFFETFLTPTNIQQVTLEMSPEAHVGFHVVFVCVVARVQQKLHWLYKCFGNSQHKQSCIPNQQLLSSYMWVEGLTERLENGEATRQNFAYLLSCVTRKWHRNLPFLQERRIKACRTWVLKKSSDGFGKSDQITQLENISYMDSPYQQRC
jgi:hypothetical protein